MSSTPPPRLALVHALRGLTALAIVPYHALVSVEGEQVWAGWYELAYGVLAVFFVMTGFVLTWVHGADVRAGWIGAPPREQRTRVRVFMLKRMLRLFPLLWILTAGVVLASLVMPGAMSTEKRNVLHLIKSFVAWPVHDVLPVLPQAWTLPHDLRFYLAFATAMLVPRRALLLGAALVGAGAIVNVGRRLLMPTWNWHYLVDFLFHPLTLPLAYGVGIGLLLRRRQFPPNALLAIATMTFAATYVADLARVLGQYDVRMLIYGFSCGLLFLAVANHDLVQHSTVPRPLLLLGESSYALYLTHIPVTVLLTRLMRPVIGDQLSDPVWIWTQVTVCVVVGIVTYQRVEQPLYEALSRRLLPTSGSPHSLRRSAEREGDA